MKSKLTILVIACFSLSFVGAVEEKRSFDRYQSIIERMPFGPAPDGFDPSVPPAKAAVRGKGAELSKAEVTQEQQQILRAINFSVINIDDDGTVAVGFSDNTDPKKAMHYYLKVGESRNGWEVLSADPKAQTMSIKKNDVEVTMKLGDREAVQKSPTAQSPGSAAPALANAQGSSENSLLSKGRPLLGRTLQARRMMREEKERQQQEAEARRVEQQRHDQALREQMKEELATLKETIAIARAREAQKAAEADAVKNQAEEKRNSEGVSNDEENNAQ
jgi:hypothetical protein